MLQDKRGQTMLPNDVPKQRIFLAGTISFPDTFPRLGEMSITRLKLEFACKKKVNILKVEERCEHYTVVRSFSLDDVSGIFIPEDARQPDWAKGRWLVGPEITSPDFPVHFTDAPQKPKRDDEKKAGIVFVSESARVHMIIETGTTAAESRDFGPTMFKPLTCNPCG